MRRKLQVRGLAHRCTRLSSKSNLNLIACRSISTSPPACGPDRVQEYLDIAARLRAELEQIEGFISIERFTSLSQHGKILSLSFWRDEDAIARWREQEQHHAAQISGRNGVFRDYRIRVAVVVRDYGMYERAQAPRAMPRVAHKRA